MIKILALSNHMAPFNEAELLQSFPEIVAIRSVGQGLRKEGLLRVYHDNWENKEAAQVFQEFFSGQRTSILMKHPHTGTPFHFFRRQEHWYLRDAIEKVSKEYAYKSGLKGVYLEGQPGIGNSSFPRLSKVIY